MEVVSQQIHIFTPQDILGARHYLDSCPIVLASKAILGTTRHRRVSLIIHSHPLSHHALSCLDASRENHSGGKTPGSVNNPLQLVNSLRLSPVGSSIVSLPTSSHPLHWKETQQRYLPINDCHNHPVILSPTPPLP